MRIITTTVIALFMALAVCSASAAETSVKGKPNILFIFADDQCYDTINALGNKEIKTPNLDRLVSRGLTFSHAYNMGS
ncbi:hypothetical protein BVX99_03300 [bacterium F16]|nr:hypothetical protein BVX99_03300 [bacterium F16]